MYRVVTPETESELNAYYQLRWELLRKPFNLPLGSERDEYDSVALHRMMLDPDGRPIAVGRLFVGGDEAQIRFMGLLPEYRGQGLGARMVEDLEALARSEKVKRLVMNARQEAVEFYRKCGFLEVGEGPVSFGRIPHRQMIKSLAPLQTIQYRPEWCQDLATRWSRGIPISEKMGMQITHYDGHSFHLGANLAANLNVHDTMFAGSIYSQCVLAGWGLIWLQLKELGLLGDTVLAEGSIRYYRPVKASPEARVAREGMPAALLPLRNNESARFQLSVQLYSGGKLAAEFTGKYVVQPPKKR
ncbi:bifunctional GNAT family N-acetyltransferase/hotdog fold thioesterase [Aeromonas simiae]|uniref:GNAT family N-acetyltransferase n=1 Tax=Aeromonas simiae TaxID=218936 RepID=A0A5J6WT68_9GAMM|nr:bifunctional GNAT family N-acetyltransferase/hotdog fold thioesterase [Aeromonas simiae]MDO2948705.1 bifunctional GNAT family N-acetyltransferase/hotdog fold thioesterase [Aeromonas simiae]MDO2952180.1 bifunctional GNAT family N-acetyltransferase/hotdog fold thioesterase [Aeromonas simiae]MDO2956088.1 bifunctional GNAT family N-acetyltransferase/hotdog fold thioesterase [Aeromonas simiae]QFI53361.1 GNAT family N-acetyltransferase [Aeromonas simiae]